MDTQIRLFIEWDGTRTGIVLWVVNISMQTFLSSAEMFDNMPTVRASAQKQQQQQHSNSNLNNKKNLWYISIDMGTHTGIHVSQADVSVILIYEHQKICQMPRQKNWVSAKKNQQKYWEGYEKSRHHKFVHKASVNVSGECENAFL